MKTRSLYLSLSFFSLAVVLSAFFFQYYDEVIPCILCIMQRILFLVLGVIALIAGVHNTQRRVGAFFYSTCLFLVSALGIGISLRHLWLQYVPASQRPLCAPSLDFIFSTLPPSDIILLFFAGSGDCGEVTWELLGLSMAAWSLMAFCVIFVGSALLLYKQFRKA